MTGLPIGQTMSYGQMSEIFFMVIMPLFFARLGVKWMLAVGMLAWVVRYGLFAIGAPDEVRWMILTGVVIHGICYDFFFVTGQIYTDRFAPKQIRAQAQGMLVLFTLGLGMFIGAQIAGNIEAKHTPEVAATFAAEVQARTTEAQGLKDQLPTIAEGEKEALQNQIAILEEEAQAARKSELKSLEWKPLGANQPFLQPSSWLCS